MDINKERKLIHNTIMRMGYAHMFTKDDLFFKLDGLYGLQNRILIEEILDDLCKSGAVRKCISDHSAFCRMLYYVETFRYWLLE